ncbi:MAG: tetratricopeptide (TPR) repeat protein [Cyclobacteriaceae bacterium]|jgi:tetratricopeptide (TPR) repeat protein
MELFTEDHFHKFKIKTHSPEWYQFRSVGIPELYPGGIGASECAKLIEEEETGVPINPYAPSPAQMYEEKIGREPIQPFANQRTFWGTMLEPTIGESWQFWDGDPESYIHNRQKWLDSGKKDEFLIRKSLDAEYYLVNEKYPWLFCSLDKAMAPGSANMITGEELLTPAPLEVKTIGEFAGKGYETGVPMQYVIQLHHQMIVTESDYAEIAILKGGNDFQVKYYSRNEDLVKIILDVTKEWWFERVIPGRRFWIEAMQAEKKGRTAEAAKLLERIDHLQPGPNSTEAYRQWKSGKFQRERSYMRGNISMYNKLREYEVAKEYLKVITQMKDRRYNEFIETLVNNQVREVVFPNEMGYIRMGKSHRLSTRIGEKVSNKMIVSNIRKLDFDIE